MTAIILPGWTCPCGRFNGAEKEWRVECSACGLRESASPGICPSDVAAGTKACCERRNAMTDEKRVSVDRAREAARGLLTRDDPDGYFVSLVEFITQAEADRAEIDAMTVSAETMRRLHAVTLDVVKLQREQLDRMAPIVDAAEDIRDGADRYPELRDAVDAYRAGTPAAVLPPTSAADEAIVDRLVAAKVNAARTFHLGQRTWDPAKGPLPQPPRFTADEARAILRADDALNIEGIGPSDEPGSPWAGMVAECKEVM